MARQSLIGMKFNKLTVLEQLPNRLIGKNNQPQRNWKCRCECGKICEKTSLQLRYTKTCGCAQKTAVRNLVQKIQPNERYAFLTTVKFEKVRGTSGWHCKCFCGNETWVRSYALISGRTKSCSCMSSAIRNETYYTNHPHVIRESRVNEIFYAYKAGARKRHRCFELTKEDFIKMIEAGCHYCGLIPDTQNLKFNGVDRIDNEKGYTLENCAPCCFQCNKAKGTYTTLEWEEWVSRISAFQAK